MTYFDPLEQFSIELIREYYNTGLDIPYVTIGKMIFLNLILILLAINGVKSIFASNIAQKLFRLLFKLVCKISKGSLDIKKHSFVVLLYLVFLFIFTSNILGLLPYSITVTSHLILTLFFSLAFFIGNNLIGLCYHKQKYFALFLPTGVPVLIIPFLILVEYVSYISRIFSLAIRLFANMMSGHILLKILISFVWAIICSDLIHSSWILLPLSVVFIVIGLEFCISFLQAYVFVTLLAIYLNDVIAH